GIDDRYRDAAAFEFEPHAFGEIDNRRLARAVAAVAGPAGIAEQRAHDGNVSRLARQHLRQHRRHRVNHAVDIERHRAVEAVEVDIANVEWRIHAGAEQSEIDRPDRTFDPDDAGFELVGLKHV